MCVCDLQHEERKKVAIVIRLLLVSKLQFNVDKSSKQKTTILVDHNEILKNILRQKISYFLLMPKTFLGCIV
jgi:hypothetical protein